MKESEQTSLSLVETIDPPQIGGNIGRWRNNTVKLAVEGWHVIGLKVGQSPIGECK